MTRHVQFGLFDHLDYRLEPPSRTYAQRLALIRAAEDAGFRGYHFAEHHGTPLGMAPSPGVFLAAAAAVTRRIRLGPMVYCLPLYHPLRLLEEICMLDHLSNGRLDVGVGRGASPFETGFFGVDPQEAVARHVETLQILRAGLAGDPLTHAGRFFSFDNVPLPLRPVQERIPFWSAPTTPDAQVHAAQAGMNIMVLGAKERVRDIVAQYRETWARHQPGTAQPLIGACRMIHVAATNAVAEAQARPALKLWYTHLARLWRENKATSPLLSLVENFDDARAAGMVIAGSPNRVRDALASQIEYCGFNYSVLQFAFGDMDTGAAAESLALFAEEVRPGLVESTREMAV